MYCFIAYFFIEIDNIDDALGWMHLQRHMSVPVYNDARLNEQPVPNINQPNNDALEQNDDGVENAVESLQPFVFLNPVELVQVNQQGVENDNQNGVDGLDEIDLLRPEAVSTVGETDDTVENQPNEAEVEIEIGAHDENGGVDPLLVVEDEVLEPINDEDIEDDLIDLFAETMIPDEHFDYFGSDDECEMSWKGPIAAPMHFDAKINDPISGNKYFTVVVSIF